MARTKINNESMLKEYLQAVSKLPRTGQEQRAVLLERWREGDSRAMRELMESFLPLVVALAAARRGLSLRFHELLENGNRALAAALRAFQGEAGDLEAVMLSAVEASLKRAWTRAAWAHAREKAVQKGA